MQLLNIPNDCLVNEDDSYLFNAMCELQLVRYILKTVSKTLHMLNQTLLWLLTQ